METSARVNIHPDSCGQSSQSINAYRTKPQFTRKPFPTSIAYQKYYTLEIEQLVENKDPFPCMDGHKKLGTPFFALLDLLCENHNYMSLLTPAEPQFNPREEFQIKFPLWDSCWCNKFISPMLARLRDVFSFSF